MSIHLPTCTATAGCDCNVPDPLLAEAEAWLRERTSGHVVDGDTRFYYLAAFAEHVLDGVRGCTECAGYGVWPLSCDAHPIGLKNDDECENCRHPCPDCGGRGVRVKEEP